MNKIVLCVASDINYQNNSIALINSVIKNNHNIDVFYRFVDNCDLDHNFNNGRVTVLNDVKKLNTKKTYIVQGFDIANETYKNISNRLVSEKLLYCVHAKYINVLEMMKEDGLFTVLPKYNDEWTNFFKPLIKLRKKEIKYYNQKQI